MDTTSEQQAACYADLLLATDEDDHSYFAGIDEEDEHAGTLAWCVLMDVYDDDGVHRKCELMEEYNRKQNAGETCIEYFNHKVGIRTQLIAIGEDVSESNLVIGIIAGLRDEYGSITDNIDQNDAAAMTITHMRRVLLQAGRRIEARIANKEALSNKAAFSASGDESFTAAAFAALKVENNELKEQLQKLSNKQPYHNTGRFRGNCNKCGKPGHKAKDCRSRPSQGACNVESQHHCAFPALAGPPIENGDNDSDSDDEFEIVPA